MITKVPGACYKRFKTLAQAKEFIDDWRSSYAEVYQREIKKALDRGLRPRDMELRVGDILLEAGTDVDSEGVLADFVKLDVKDAEAK